MSGRDFEHGSADAAAARRIGALLAEEAARWYVAQREGALAPEQARAFMEWLQASPRHVAEYLAVAAMAEELPEAACRDPAAQEELLAQAATEANVAELQPPAGPRAAGGRAARAAAAQAAAPASGPAAFAAAACCCG